MTIKNALAGVAVRDLDEAVTWYTRLLGRAPDQRPLPDLAEYGFERGGWLQLFSYTDRAGKSSVTFAVDDLDSKIGEPRNAGISSGVPTCTANVDTTIVNDPDGNQIVFAEAKTSAKRAVS